MEAFHDIESLRHVVQHINARAEFHNLETKPVVTFRGTVKLHGTNAGVRVRGRHVVLAHGRNRELTIHDDNFGFALFTAHRNSEFINLAKLVNSDDVTFYGEYCGIGIQKGVAVASLPKMFVIFAVKDHATDSWLDIREVHALNDADDVNWLNNQKIYFITQVPGYEVKVDFNDPTPAAEAISDLTLQVEERCPFANSNLFLAFNHGENIGIGEGIVWVSQDYTDEGTRRLIFKSKGLKHKKAGSERKVVEVNPEKVASVNALVDLVLPEWRLEQGLDHLRQTNKPFAMQSTGDYLKWIAGDIKKEETDRMIANNLGWKDIANTVNKRAQAFFAAELDRRAGIIS